MFTVNKLFHNRATKILTIIIKRKKFIVFILEIHTHSLILINRSKSMTQAYIMYITYCLFISIIRTYAKKNK
jgi:hypothetical protein